MRVVNKKDKISVFIINKDRFNKETINEDIKKLILQLKRKYRKNIYGFYIAHIYYNKFGVVVELEKEEDMDFFKDMLDLKVVLHDDEDVFLVFDDYFLFNEKEVYVFDNRYYLNVEDVNYKEFLSVCEFCDIIYGDELKFFKNNFKLVNDK